MTTVTIPRDRWERLIAIARAAKHADRLEREALLSPHITPTETVQKTVEAFGARIDLGKALDILTDDDVEDIPS
jgi:hypothetical protein